MSDLHTLFKEAAAPAQRRTLDAERAMRRGDQLRRRRMAVQAGSLALVVLAVPLLLNQLGSNSIEFVPDKRPVYSTPTPSPSPTPSLTPDPDGSAPDAEDLPAVIVPAPDAGPETSTSDAGQADGTQVASGGGRSPSRPVRDGTSEGKSPAKEPRADEPDTAPEEPSPPKNTSSQPPPAASCELRGEDLQMGQSATCEFTATHTGGYHAEGLPVPFVYDPDVAAPPDYWVLTIERGDQVIRYSSSDAPASCSDQLVQVGDVIRASVYRPDPTEDNGYSGYANLSVGRGHGCP